VTLYIASSGRIHEHKPIGVCRVMTKDGPCGTLFFPGEERKQGQHAATCAAENHEYLVAYLRTRRPDIMKPWDTEYAEWIDRHRKPLLEGRMKA
jgi:hypothetical protein